MCRLVTALCEGFSESTCIIQRLWLPSKLARRQRLFHACKYSERYICHWYMSLGRPTDSRDCKLCARGIYKFNLQARHSPRHCIPLFQFAPTEVTGTHVVVVVGRTCLCLSQRRSLVAFLVHTEDIFVYSLYCP